MDDVDRSLGDPLEEHKLRGSPPIGGVVWVIGWLVFAVMVLSACVTAETSTTTSSDGTTTTLGTTSTTLAPAITTTAVLPTTTSTVVLDTKEATRRLEGLLERAEGIVAGSGDVAALDQIAKQAGTIGALVSDEAADPRYGPTMNALLALIRAGRDGLQIGSLLGPDTVVQLPGEGVAVDIHGLIVLIDLDGTVMGHLDRYRIDYRFTAPGPIVLRDANDGLWILDGDGLHEGAGVPLTDGTMLVVGDDGWEIRRDDTIVFDATSETTFYVSAHRDVITATEWSIDGRGNAVAGAPVAIDLADGSETTLGDGCVVVDRVGSRFYLACTSYGASSSDQPGGDISEIRTLDGDVLVPSAAREYEVPVGHWRWGEVSPDGSELLLQWSAECETPVAFFAPTSGGNPVGYDGADDWTDTPESFGLGWTSDGHALILAWGKEICGAAADRPGVHLMDGPGDGRLLYQVDGSDARLWRGRD
ncbi:MAG TPA: hypothetical protein ENH00_07210 [Actinobacteria bacterium]|nr:hypothetical protein BMS3Bbin01_02960 [bacterium BMS3Bbin01]HDH25964.1 hypothetical protein [Actinomycetota bacterium]